jgi:hypothetical protein
MSRHTTFKFCIDPTVEQHELLSRHAGASRFAFNQCLAMVKNTLTRRETHPEIEVPWTGFDGAAASSSPLIAGTRQAGGARRVGRSETICRWQIGYSPVAVVIWQIATRMPR